MRHRLKGRKLKRPTPHRLLLLRTLANDLIKYEKIETTTAKAKELKRYIERVINIAKNYDPQNTNSISSMNSARRVFSLLGDKSTTKKILTELAQRYKGVNGGFVRVIKTGNRRGDNAETSVISFV
ncbi:MAG: 50S ribosomal protein L17 [Candidatus Calescibacterium sp.]|nr:50S ribosomal protein L17 [Candidatus Calescibacterium sp.]MCX7733836.1 50S ribosomal protein L17 [bacterium]MDW8086617.1 50S ribosomal protein L17 [Candidatus Calescibacterium sp.]